MAITLKANAGLPENMGRTAFVEYEDWKPSVLQAVQRALVYVLIEGMRTNPHFLRLPYDYFYDYRNVSQWAGWNEAEALARQDSETLLLSRLENPETLRAYLVQRPLVSGGPSLSAMKQKIIDAFGNYSVGANLNESHFRASLMHPGLERLVDTFVWDTQQHISLIAAQKDGALDIDTAAKATLKAEFLRE
jgi:hypothetical protein